MSKTTQPIPKPAIRKVRGSYFPAIPQRAYYRVEAVDGSDIYEGTSQHVARLLVACLTPRNC